MRREDPNKVHFDDMHELHLLLLWSSDQGCQAMMQEPQEFQSQRLPHSGQRHGLGDFQREALASIDVCARREASSTEPFGRMIYFVVKTQR